MCINFGSSKHLCQDVATERTICQCVYKKSPICHVNAIFKSAICIQKHNTFPWTPNAKMSLRNKTKIKFNGGRKRAPSSVCQLFDESISSGIWLIPDSYKRAGLKLKVPKKSWLFSVVQYEEELERSWGPLLCHPKSSVLSLVEAADRSEFQFQVLDGPNFFLSPDGDEESSSDPISALPNLISRFPMEGKL